MTREERKRLREDVKMWRACLSLERSAVGVCITPVHVADVSALLDALDEAEAELAGYEVRQAEAVTGAEEMNREMADLRERVAALEKVREAARQFISSFDTEIPEDADSEQVNKLVGQYTHAADALRAALDKAGER